MKVLEPGGTDTLSKIFELKLPADEIADEFGYSLSKTKLDTIHLSTLTPIHPTNHHHDLSQNP